MEIVVALDGEKRRDLEFFPGDDSVINVTVYAEDGDEDAIVPTDMVVSYPPGPNENTITPGDAFVATDICQRTPYTLTGVVSGSRTTLAYGLLYRRWIDPSVTCYRWCCGHWDYGGPCA